jgi:hypothetical protein
MMSIQRIAQKRFTPKTLAGGALLVPKLQSFHSVEPNERSLDQSSFTLLSRGDETPPLD